MQSIEQKVELLLRANQKLTNELEDVNKRFDKLKDITQQLYSRINQLELTRESQPMICGSGYVKEIESIVEANEVKWKDSSWINYTIQLKGYSEVFIVFVPSDIELKPNQSIQFTYEGGSRLKSVKIKNW